MNSHHILAELVARTTCKPSWRFKLVNDEDGLRLMISVTGPNSRHPSHQVTIQHYFPVPEAGYNVKSWQRWIFECCRKVEDHELGEWFLVSEARPFAPLHGPGCDPYTVREVSTEEEVRTDQRGNVAPAGGT